MRDDLAQQLLASVLGWETERLRAERHELQTLSVYKYDGYENFEPGVKFIESLARWLYQFNQSSQDREIAYQFIRDKLIFVSNTEILHLVRMLYPDVIRPILRREVASQIGVPHYQVSRIEDSDEFQTLLRRSLFLGMSDGARIDVFRRSSEDLDNEQVYGVYEPGSEKLASMQRKLYEALGEPADAEATFRMLFLIDDFAGTGKTILRRAEDGGAFDGRLRRISDLLQAPENSCFRGPDGVEVVVCLYMATEKAVDHIEGMIAEFTGAAWANCRVEVIQRVSDRFCIEPGVDEAFDNFLNRYYSRALEDRESYRVGQNGIKYGFGATGLPLVLSHNTPNNSLYLLWKDGNEDHPLVPLFGRFERHRNPARDSDGDQ